MYNNKLARTNQMAPSYIPNSLAKKPVDVRRSLGPVDREFANVETEGGETVYLPSKEGLPAHYNINGPRHHEGGVPMSIPPDSFVYSDTASMRIKDADLQVEFGMPINKKGYTPAEIAKKYDINKYRKILVDPMSDKLQVNTAEQVIANYELKLAKLALIQESMKGFPAGIPLVAMPFLAKYQLDPQMFLPTEPNQGQGGMEQMGGQPQARYGGSLRSFQTGGPNTTTPQYYVPPGVSVRQERRERKRLDRERQNLILDQALKQVLSEVNATREPEADESTGVFMREDDAGNMYFVDGRGVRIKAYDDAYYGKGNQPTVGGTNIVVKNGKRYRVEVKEKKTNIDPSKVKPKAEALSAGDIYEENGKYYVVRGYDPTKPVHATKSGDKYNGDIEADKVRALQLLEDLQKNGHAVYHDQPYMVGSKRRDPGWEIRSSAKNSLSTTDKEMLTDLFSYNKQEGKLGSGTDPRLNVSLQTAGNTGFYGYTNPDFYEYRFWKAKNPNKNAQDWDALDTKVKTENRRDMMYRLGFDTTDPHIKNNLENPDALYSNNFVSGKSKVKTNRVITDENGNQHDALGLTDAYEAYFTPGDFRPALGSDNKLGLEHADAFTYERPVEEITSEPGQTIETEIPDTPQYTSGNKYTPWWLQDVIKTTGAAVDYLSLKKYMPTKLQYNPNVPEPTFYDPSREIAALQETANIAGQTIQGTNAKSATFSSRMAGLQGNVAKAIADTMGKYNTQNVGVANEFAYKASEIMNSGQLVNLEAAQKYVDQVNTVNQNYDNSKRAARAEMRSSYIDAITNRSQAQVLNTLYPNYQIDPGRGGDLVFYKGKDLTGVDTPSQLQADKFVSWADKHPEFSQQEALDIWRGTTKGAPQQYNPNADYYDAYSNAAPQYPVNPMAYAGYMAGQEPQQKKGGPKLPFVYTTGY